MIGKWFAETYHTGKGKDLTKLSGMAGGLVQVLFLSNEHESNKDFNLFTVKDFKTGKEFHFEDYILQLMYTEIPEAEVILYAKQIRL